VTCRNAERSKPALAGPPENRPHQSCGGRPPAERFALANQDLTADSSAVAAGPAPRLAAGRRPAGVSRWVNAHGKISLAGFSYFVGATYAGEPVEVVTAGGLVDILHAGVVVAMHVQRLRADQADRAPRARVARKARDAAKGLTVTRLANHDGQVTFAGTTYRAGRMWARTFIDVTIVAGSVQLSKDGKVIRVHPIRHDRSRELGAFANPQPRPPQELRHRIRQLATGSHQSPRYRYLTRSSHCLHRPSSGRHRAAVGATRRCLSARRRGRSRDWHGRGHCGARAKPGPNRCERAREGGR
jgi:hypothetical protein